MNNKRDNVLIAYFSQSGNTREIAHQIHEIIGGSLFEIEPVDPYPRDNGDTVTLARKQLNEGHRPGLKTTVTNMDTYKVVFIGFPNWWNTIPMPIASFLAGYDFSGKSIAAFCTHGGSGLGRSITDIQKICPHSIMMEGLEIRGSRVTSAQNEIKAWLHNLDMI